MNRDTFIFYPYVLGVFWITVAMYIYNIPLLFDIKLILMWASVALLYTIVLKMRYICLDYMSSSSYFINYRIFISIGLLFVWTLLFQETITFKEYLWIGLWFIIFYLLIEKKTKSESINDLKKWYLFLAISVLFAVLIWVIQKQATFSVQDIWSFVFYNSFIGILVSFYMWYKWDYKRIIKVDNWKAIFFLGVTSIFFVTPYFFHLYPLYAGWDVAIVYKIISYGLIFPILFSIIYYKESVTWKKLLAFLLTIISIALFI